MNTEGDRDAIARDKREALRRLAAELRELGLDPEAELRSKPDPASDAAAAEGFDPHWAQAVLDAIPASVAVLDGGGRILATNRAWRRFAQANGATCAPERSNPDYLAVCRRAAQSGCRYAARAADGLRSVLERRAAEFSLEYPCDSPTEQRWFRLLVARLDGPETRVLAMHVDVSDRHLAETALRDSEAKYRTLFDSHPQPTWVYDLETLRFLAVNEAAVRSYGYSRDQFLAMGIEDIRPAEDIPRLREHLARLGRSFSSGVWRHRLRDGRLIHVAISSSDLEFGGRRARLVQAIDVSEQIAAQEALAASERQLRAIHDSEPECVKTVSPDGRLLTMNPAGLAMIQAAQCPEQVLGRKVERLIHPEDLPAFEALHRRVCHGGSGELQFRIIGLAGRQLWMETRSVPLLDAAGNVLAVLSVTRDITEKRRAESRLRLLEAAIERINDVVLLADAPATAEADFAIRYANPAFYRLSGYGPDEVLGRSPDILHGPDTSQTEAARIRDSLRDGRPVRAEMLSYAKDGRQYWIELEAVPIRDERGRMTHIVSIERDITERRGLEAKLRQTQRMEAIGELTGGIAHDFNNLLTVIQGNAELLAEALGEQPRLQALARRVDEASQRGANLTHHLLAFARRQSLQPRPLDLDALLEEFRPLLLRALSAEIQLEIDCPPGLPAAVADPGELEAALLNLCLNARDAMPRGGRLRIAARGQAQAELPSEERSALAPGSYIVLSLEDTGVGIAANDLARVFEPFFTTKDEGRGSGLGLAMVYGFARQSGGHVSIASRPGQGTRVRLYLPVAESAGEPASEVHADAPRALQPATILLVEDEAGVRSLARSLIEALGHAVVEAENAREALDRLRERADIALLFTDVVMPGGMNGAELAAAAHELRPGLPVVFTSGYTQDALSEGGHLPADVLLLRKPYRRRELARLLREALIEGGPNG